jgi:hypothetical protein
MDSGSSRVASEDRPAAVPCERSREGRSRAAALHLHLEAECKLRPTENDQPSFLGTTKGRNSKPSTRGAGSTSVVGLLASAACDNPTLVPKRCGLGEAASPTPLAPPCPVFLEPNNFVRHFEGGEMWGAGMKTRCDYCCGPFGLVRRRNFDHQFCCEVCEEAYKQRRAKMVAQFKSGFYSTVSDGSGRQRT